MISFENVSKTFGTGESALSDINLTINDGEFVFIIGPSGSGKTTLFRLLTREIVPTHGNVTVNEMSVNKLPRGKIPQLRRKIGVVFQDLKLLTERTIAENIMLPLLIAGMDSKKSKERIHEVMSQVNILEHQHKFPVQLSGGELQRAAIARAIVFTPDILIADEPTGNLDSATSWEIVKLLQEINQNGTTVLMATHNTDIVSSLNKRIILLENGRISRDDKTVPVAPDKILADNPAENQHLDHAHAHDKKHKKEDKT